MRLAIASLVGTALLAAPAAADTIERTVKANARSAIGGFLGYEVDTCYPSQIPDVKVRKAPSHGTLQIVPHEDKLGKNSRCPGLSVRGLAYVYTPNKGFKGADEVVLDIPWFTTDSTPMQLWSYTYKIRVE